MTVLHHPRLPAVAQDRAQTVHPPLRPREATLGTLAATDNSSHQKKRLLIPIAGMNGRHSSRAVVRVVDHGAGALLLMTGRREQKPQPPWKKICRHHHGVKQLRRRPRQPKSQG